MKGAWIDSTRILLNFTNMDVFGNKRENMTIKFESQFVSFEGAALYNNTVWAHPFAL